MSQTEPSAARVIFTHPGLPKLHSWGDAPAEPYSIRGSLPPNCRLFFCKYLISSHFSATSPRMRDRFAKNSAPHLPSSPHHSLKMSTFTSQTPACTLFTMQVPAFTIFTPKKFAPHPPENISQTHSFYKKTHSPPSFPLPPDSLPITAPFIGSVGVELVRFGRLA